MSMYSVIDQASEAAYFHDSSLQEAIDYARSLPKQGRFLVMDDDDNILFDTNPEINFKI